MALGAGARENVQDGPAVAIDTGWTTQNAVIAAAGTETVNTELLASLPLLQCSRQSASDE